MEKKILNNIMNNKFVSKNQKNLLKEIYEENILLKKEFSEDYAKKNKQIIFLKENLNNFFKNLNKIILNKNINNNELINLIYELDNNIDFLREEIFIEKIIYKEKENKINYEFFKLKKLSFNIKSEEISAKTIKKSFIQNNEIKNLNKSEIKNKININKLMKNVINFQEKLNKNYDNKNVNFIKKKLKSDKNLITIMDNIILLNKNY